MASRRREEEVASRRREEDSERIAKLERMVQGAQEEAHEAMAASRELESSASGLRELDEAGTPWSAAPHC